MYLLTFGLGYSLFSVIFVVFFVSIEPEAETLQSEVTAVRWKGKSFTLCKNWDAGVHFSGLGIREWGHGHEVSVWFSFQDLYSVLFRALQASRTSERERENWRDWLLWLCEMRKVGWRGGVPSTVAVSVLSPEDSGGRSPSSGAFLSHLARPPADWMEPPSLGGLTCSSKLSDLLTTSKKKHLSNI